MTIYACDRCGLVYLEQPPDTICVAMHGRVPVSRELAGQPYACGGQVREVPPLTLTKLDFS